MRIIATACPWFRWLCLVCLFFPVCFVTLIGSPARADTGFVDRTVTVAGQRYRYEVYVPAEFGADRDRDRKWPVLIDLHGNGAQGTDGIRQTAHFLPEEIRLRRRDFPLIVVFPQAAPETTWTTPAMQEMVMAEADAALAEFHGDPDRVYLSGFSMGGAGVYAIAARWPARFAALVSIAGAAPEAGQDRLAKQIAAIPIRVFSGDADERVPVEGARRIVAALRRAGAAVEYVEYPGTRHGPSAEKAYAERDLITWLLAHQRQQAARSGGVGGG